MKIWSTRKPSSLKRLASLMSERREIARLEEVTQSGAISAKTLLERKYSRDKTESSLAATREALKLHGLSAAQIATMKPNANYFVILPL